MSNLALDIRELPVRIHLESRAALDAVLYLHRHGPRGQEGLLERLNGSEAFFPCRSDNGICLVSRASIVLLESGEVPLEVEEMTEFGASRIRLKLRTRTGVELVGSCLVLMPDNHNRLLDFLNLKENFFAMFLEHGVVVVNKQWIEFVEPLMEGA